MGKIKVGVIGIGHLGTFHLQKYDAIEDCEITAVADIEGERARHAAERFGCRAFTDYHELLDRVDAVSIAVPTQFHYETARPFLARGIDVLLEKPITDRLEDADELVALADANKAVFQIGFVERFNPAIVALGKVLTRPLFIETHRLHPFFERGTDVDVVLDLMIHDLDIILNTVQSPVVQVDAVGVSVMSEKVDIANARITFESGCVANVTASRITNKTMQKIRFFGFDSYHSVDYGKRELLSLRRTTNSEGRTDITENRVAVVPQDPLEAEIRSFIDAVNTRKEALVSGKEGRKSLELALMIIERMKIGEEITGQ